jgi:hypothetical protein
MILLLFVMAVRALFKAPADREFVETSPMFLAEAYLAPNPNTVQVEVNPIHHDGAVFSERGSLMSFKEAVEVRDHSSVSFGTRGSRIIDYSRATPLVNHMLELDEEEE